MNQQQAKEALELLDLASRQQAAQRYGNLERQLDAADRVLVMGVTSDFLFTIDQQRDLAAQFEATGKPVSLVELDSIQGHDSFLVDMDRFRPVLASFFGGDWGALAALLAASHAGVNPS